MYRAMTFFMCYDLYMSFVSSHIYFMLKERWDAIDVCQCTNLLGMNTSVIKFS